MPDYGHFLASYLVIVRMPLGMLESLCSASTHIIQVCNNTCHLNFTCTYRTVPLVSTQGVHVSQCCVYYYYLAGWVAWIIQFFSGGECHSILTRTRIDLRQNNTDTTKRYLKVHRQKRHVTEEETQESRKQEQVLLQKAEHILLRIRHPCWNILVK